MAYKALYREWRPKVFEDVVEQEHVVRTLMNSVKTDSISHSYLFCGTRGTGKTTMAKIFSRAINCLNPKNGDPCNECEVCRGLLNDTILDVIEIDAASNNSVDNVRQIRDEVIYSPTRAKWKVYIIDEVHMLSTGAFNALLKTLEEPPAHVVFILATTDPHKLPATILSRCQRFDFRRISEESIAERLADISGKIGVSADKEALQLIARLADGALRDAISILDQCLALGTGKISYEDVISMVGIVNDSFMKSLASNVKNGDVAAILGGVDELVRSGKDIPHFVSDLILFYRNILVAKLSGTSADAAIKELAGSFTNEEIYFVIEELSKLLESLRWADLPRTLLEVALIKLATAGKTDNTAASAKANQKQAAEETEESNKEQMTESNAIQENASKEASPVEENSTIGTIPTANNSTIGTVPTAKNPTGGTVPLRSGKWDVGCEKGPTAGTVPVGGELARWNEILNELKSMGRMSIYLNLLNSKAYELGEKTIGLLFGGISHVNEKVIFSPDNLVFLESFIGQKLGREIRLKHMNEDEAPSVKVKETPKKEKESFLDKAKKATSGLNIDIKIIDE